MTKLEHGIAEIKDNDLFGLQIKHAFIIVSQNPLIHAEMMMN